MKALPPKVAFLLLKYLILVRPCEELFAPHVGMSLLQQENYSTHLFVTHGDVMKQELLRQLMRRISKDFFGESFSWNQYRHFMKAVLLFITGIDLDNIAPLENRALDEAFHHNRGIADSAYATSADDHESSREAPFETYLRVSFLLHDWYGIGAHVPAHPLSVPTADRAVTHSVSCHPPLISA